MTTLLRKLQEKFPDRSRDELYGLIMCGEIEIGGERIRDPRAVIAADAEPRIRARQFVSRGGIKLAAALDDFGIAPEGLTVLDAGSSTGGFTDCLLQRGAALVHAVDVGTNQLAWSLRSRSDVRVYERTNIMSLDSLDPTPDIATCDLSFRSLRGVANHILSLTAKRQLIALAKPQFEWGDTPDSFDGVVRDVDTVLEILIALVCALREEQVHVVDVAESTIAGREGNREFFLDLRPNRGSGSIDATELVRLAVHHPKDSLDSGSHTSGLSGAK